MRRAWIHLLALTACDWSRPLPLPADAGADCPTVIGTGSVAIDLGCRADVCTLIAREEACTLELAISGCTEAIVRADIATDGTLAFRPSAELGTCQSIEARSDALASLLCETDELICRADLYSANLSIDAEVARVSIYDVPFRAPEGTPVEPLDRTEVLRAYLSDAAATDDRIVISGFNGEFRRAKCDDDEASFSFVDPTTMTVVETATAPPCLMRIGYDRARDQIVGISGGATPRIDRFDLRGRSVKSALISFPPEPAAAYTTSLTLDSSADQARVTITADDEPRFTYVVTIALETFDVVQTSERIDAFVRVSALLEAGMFASDGEGGVVRRIANNGALLAPLVLLYNPIVGLSDDAGFIAEHDDTGRVLVATTGRSAAVWSFDPSAQNAVDRVGVYYLRAAAPWAIGTWPKDRRVMAVGVTEAVGTFDARLALFDVREGRFRAQTLKIGRGLVGKLLTDRAERVWALLPWSAELVRITPR